MSGLVEQFFGCNHEAVGDLGGAVRRLQEAVTQRTAEFAGMAPARSELDAADAGAALGADDGRVVSWYGLYPDRVAVPRRWGRSRRIEATGSGGRTHGGRAHGELRSGPENHGEGTAGLRKNADSLATCARIFALAALEEFT